MAQINQLPTRTLSAGDVVPFFSSNNGDAAKASFTSIAALISDILGLDSAAAQVTQYESPENAATVVITEKSAPTWLILTPVDTGNSITITLPSSSEAANQMQITVSTDTAITISYSSTGATVVYSEPLLGVGGGMTMKYDSVAKRWYQIDFNAGNLA
jgi:hypothetical protein